MITILFEDEDFLLLNKPPGLISVPGAGIGFEQTLAGWVRQYLGSFIEKVGEEKRWGLVHRLDKDTSGVMVVAKNARAYEHLKNEFRSFRVKKFYWALVWGMPQEEYFAVDAPVGRHPRQWARWIVRQDGKRAVTLFHLKKKNLFHRQLGEEYVFSWLVCRPLTGRTHQIRVHLKALGYPILGDYYYGGRRKYRIIRSWLKRPFLHARKLAFYDLNGKLREFKAPLAADLRWFVRGVTTKKN